MMAFQSPVVTSAQGFGMVIPALFARISICPDAARSPNHLFDARLLREVRLNRNSLSSVGFNRSEDLISRRLVP